MFALLWQKFLSCLPEEAYFSLVRLHAIFFRLVKLTEHDVNAWKHLQLYDHDINCMLLNLECLAKFCRTIFAMNIKKNYYSTRKAM